MSCICSQRPNRTELTITYIEEFDDAGSAAASRPVPVEPDGFDATTSGDGRWRVTWMPVAGVSGYEYSHELTNATTVETITSFFGIPHGESRDVKVRSIGRGGVSAWVTVTVDTSGEQVKVTSDRQAPSAVSAAPRAARDSVRASEPRCELPSPTVTHVVPHERSIAVTWRSPNATRWNARLFNARHGLVQQAIDLTEPHHTFTDLDPYTTYGVRIQAFDERDRVLASTWSAPYWTVSNGGSHE